MKITSENIMAHELIGIDVDIVESKNPSMMNLNGKLVYETKNTLVLKVGKEKRIIPKNVTLLRLKLPDNIQCLINGSALIGRPEDRIQKLK